ncbi:MAG: DUF3343 domain-containing protein [Deltaproteobacteria bacterium]|jgi:hypothetical protein|nr:DUF3343 domain-containing protein [Deltaproteobacteria bacterium]
MNLARSGEIILVFASNTMILEAEELLEDKDLPFELIPVPKEVNPNCGLAISFSEEDRDLILPALKEATLAPSAGYFRMGDVFEDRSGEILAALS